MPSVVALKYQCDRAWFGVRSRSRKLILDAGAVPWLFFDLDQDPLEQSNLVNDPARRPEINALRHSLTAELDSSAR